MAKSIYLLRNCDLKGDYRGCKTVGKLTETHPRPLSDFPNRASH